MSRSRVVALTATVVSVAAFPRSYGYPKALLYAAAPLAIWAWVHNPKLGRLVLIAALVAVAFLFRHDHGLYLGAAALVTILAAPAFDRQTRWGRALLFGASVVVLLAPFLLFVQRHEGLLNYASAAIEFSRREADRTQLHLTAIQGTREGWLFYGLHALALTAIACAWFEHRRGSRDALLAVPLVVSAVLVNINFLRDPLEARLPDVIVPAVLLGAWLSSRAFRIQPSIRRAAAVVAVAMMWAAGVVSVSAVGHAREQLERTDLWLGIGQLPHLLREKTAQLTTRYAREQLPDGRLLQLVPFFEYVDRCTTVRQRLLVAGNAPEVYIYARRPFAAGHSTFIEGYTQSSREQQRLLERAQSQVVAFVLILSDEYETWRRGFPQLNAFVESRFTPMADIAVGPTRTVRVLVHTGLPPTHIDRPTGWPCFVTQAS